MGNFKKTLAVLILSSLFVLASCGSKGSSSSTKAGSSASATTSSSQSASSSSSTPASSTAGSSSAPSVTSTPTAPATSSSTPTSSTGTSSSSSSSSSSQPKAPKITATNYFGMPQSDPESTKIDTAYDRSYTTTVKTYNEGFITIKANNSSNLTICIICAGGALINYSGSYVDYIKNGQVDSFDDGTYVVRDLDNLPRSQKITDFADRGYSSTLTYHRDGSVTVTGTLYNVGCGSYQKGTLLYSVSAKDTDSLESYSSSSLIGILK